ncbi:MAG: AAA family ATPase [Caulobacterales bacterium]|nr:AAA family ATPase [Caulobacterales bacterium]
MASAFISFAAAETHLAQRALAEIQAAGVSAWGFEGALAANADLPAEVSEHIKAASSVILIYTPTAMTSNWVARQYEFARRHRKPIFVVREPSTQGDDRRFPGLSDLLHVEGSLDDGQLWGRVAFHAERAQREHCPVITFMNAKGGVGKTTLAANIAGALNRLNPKRRILLLDLDPQFNLTQIFQSPRLLEEYFRADMSMISLFEDSQVHGKRESPSETLQVGSAPGMKAVNLEALVQRAPTVVDTVSYELNIIYGQSEIIKYALSSNAIGKKNRREKFARSISHLREMFDAIILDTNPGISFLAQCARDVSDFVVAPILPNEFSLRGLKLLTAIDQFLSPPPVPPQRLVVVNNSPRAPLPSESEFLDTLSNGGFNEAVGSDVAVQLLKPHILESSHYRFQGVGEVMAPLDRLIAFKPVDQPGIEEARDNLFALTEELWRRVKPRGEILSE